VADGVDGSIGRWGLVGGLAEFREIELRYWCPQTRLPAWGKER
jgi:hypothetical protein